MGAKKKKLKYLLLTGTITVVFIIVLGALTWLYVGQLTAPKVKIFSRLPLPLSLVGDKPLPVSEFLELKQLASTLGTPTTSRQIYSKMISNSELDQLCKKRGIFITRKELDAEYQSGASQNNNGQGDLTGQLASYGVSKNFFENQVILPELELADLQTWFFGQQDLNAGTYQFADTLVDQIKGGSDMGQLAESYSEDQTGPDLQGDSGFVDPTSLLPELREPISTMTAGQVKILPNRLGISVIKLENKSGNLVQLRQILLTGSDFNSWLALQQQSFFKIKFLNLNS